MRAISRLDNSLLRTIERRLATVGIENATVRTVAPAHGASFDRAFALTLADGRRMFAKIGPADVAERFRGEAAGLRALGEPGRLRVPRWVAAGCDEDGSGQSFVVMEAIATAGAASPAAWRRLGRALAEHHRATRGDRFGFERDTHCGATRQPNDWRDDGVAFWRHQRLGYQLALAGERGLADAAFARAGERFLDRLDGWLDASERPCLIHGDLWRGNVLTGASGTPAVIDPAVYHGHREAELAMCHLFGGFPRAFFDAYEEAWPLPDRAGDRRPLFTLYHLLNHLNLFGLGYRDACMRILSRM